MHGTLSRSLVALGALLVATLAAACGDTTPTAHRGHAPESLDDAVAMAAARGEELLALDEALRQLQSLDERHARIVECRFFGGMSVEETADALGVSPATVKREWTLARAWLNRELSA